MPKDSAATIPPPSSKGRSADARCRRCSASRTSTACSPARATRSAADARNGERLRAARLNALLELVYATGLRVSELVSLPASAAERNARMLVVRGKGGKERLVPLNDAAKTAMTEYRALLAERGSKDRRRRRQTKSRPKRTSR